MKIRGIVLSIQLLLAITAANAGTPQKELLHWEESHGEIVLDSVCDDFAYGSIDYRECRVATKHLFEERCKEYGNKADNARGERREEYWRQRDKYCSAASRFSPVN